jgi:hypothetical protein
MPIDLSQIDEIARVVQIAATIFAAMGTDFDDIFRSFEGSLEMVN